jgi:hypothetical protein
VDFIENWKNLTFLFDMNGHPTTQIFSSGYISWFHQSIIDNGINALFFESESSSNISVRMRHPPLIRVQATRIFTALHV